MKAIFFLMSLSISFSSWGHSGDSRPHTQHTDSQCYNLIVENNQPGERVCPPGVQDTTAGAQAGGSQQPPEYVTLNTENGSVQCEVRRSGTNVETVCPNQGQPTGRSQSQRCVAALNSARMNYEAALQVTPPQAQTAAKNSAITQLNQQKFCRQLEITSVANGSSLNDGPDQTVSMDRRVVCQKAGGYTLDWQSCKNGVNAYNLILGADKALDMVQQVQAQQNSRKLGEEYAQAAQEGAGQDAAYEAMVQERRKMASMHEQKAVAYLAAVAALGNSIMRWQGKSEGAVSRLCSGYREGGRESDLLPQETCPNAISQVKGTSGVFANDAGKAALVQAFMEYMAKAIKAKMDANQLRNIAKQISDVKNDVQDLGPTMFERCSVAPNDPACQQAGGPRIPGQEFTGGDFSIGENFNNSFGDPLQETPNVDFDPENLTPGGAVASAGNPFEDAAKEASGILDKAPAANFQPGSTPGGGGGGAGGGLGGGGASLGNDLNGPEGEKTAEVKAEKSGGNYNFAGGGGFQAIKPGKEDANPFASLFDSKSQGGVGEDRSFASDDIGGKDSGLFLRISRRYGKISGEKRIEAMNLE